MSMLIDSYRFGSAAPIVGWVSSADSGTASTNTTNMVVTLPTGRTIGDVMIATIVATGAVGWTTPTGWTLAANKSTAVGLDIDMSVFYRVVDGSESSTTTFVYGSGARWAAVCQLYRGFSSVTAHNPVQLPTSNFAASATIAEWSGTPTGIAAGDTLVSLFAATSVLPALTTDVFTNPASTTLRDSHRLDNGVNRAVTILAADRVAVGSDSAGVWTAGGSNSTHDNVATCVLVLNP